MWPCQSLYSDYLPGFAPQKAQTILKVRARVGEESQNLCSFSSRLRRLSAVYDYVEN